VNQVEAKREIHHTRQNDWFAPSQNNNNAKKKGKKAKGKRTKGLKTCLVGLD